MTDDDRVEFGQVLSGVLAYYRQETSRAILSLWWEACREYDLAAVRQVLSQHVQDPDRGQYPPKIADLTRLLMGSSADRATIAWGVVLRAAALVGAYRDVSFGSDAVHQAIVDLGGWQTLCRTEADELRHLQHRFSTAFRTYVQRGAPDAPLFLAGERSADDVYIARGLAVPKAVQIASVVRTAPLLKDDRILRIGS